IKQKKDKKMTKYNKSEIMKNAWAMFNSYEWDVENFKFVSAENKTFSNCLKEAWAEEKEYVERKAKETAEAPRSEEAKAWDWACRKLNVNDLQNIDATDKVFYVVDMQKEMWTSNVWAQAIKAVELYVKLGLA
ncbi:TPA: anti-CRISPR protein AcrIIA3, partial [Streptococcus pyogenes]